MSSLADNQSPWMFAVGVCVITGWFTMKSLKTMQCMIRNMRNEMQMFRAEVTSRATMQSPPARVHLLLQGVNVNMKDDIDDDMYDENDENEEDEEDDDEDNTDGSASEFHNDTVSVTARDGSTSSEDELHPAATSDRIALQTPDNTDDQTVPSTTNGVDPSSSMRIKKDDGDGSSEGDDDDDMEEAEVVEGDVDGVDGADNPSDVDGAGDGDGDTTSSWLFA